MEVIRVENDYSCLVTNNTALKEKFHKLLRIRPKNYFHSTAYKKRRWDGWREYFDKKTGIFLTGLLHHVAHGLHLLNLPYQIVDNRDGFQWLHNSIDDQFLNKNRPKDRKPVTLYDYQVEFANLCIKHHRGIVSPPTSSGKTNILISVLKSIPPKTPILFLTKDSSLVDQNYQTMKSWGIPYLGRYYGGYKEFNYIMCCTVHKDTFEGIKGLLPKFKALFVDEVHACMSQVPIAAYKRMKAAKVRIGFSATPFKFGGTDHEHKFNVLGYFGPLFKLNETKTKTGLLSTNDLQERGILAKSRCYFYPINDPANIQHEPYGDAVTLGIAENLQFHFLVKKLAQSLKGRTLILVERIDQGNYLKQLLPDAHWINGEDSIEARAKVFEELRSKKDVNVIAMRHIVTAGIDVFIHNLINAAGGKADHSVIQQMGRGLRRAEDKEVLTYYDFIFTTNEYLQNHSVKRISLLEQEGHDIILKEEIDF